MKSTSRKVPPVLKQFAGLWTMHQQPLGKREWSLEEKFRQAKKAGFEAMGGERDSQVLPLCEKYGMDYVCYIDANAKTYKERLEEAHLVKPARINVQMCDHDTLPKDSVKVWMKLAALAEKMGLQVDLEVHRDTCTETPEKVCEMSALYQKATGKKIRFCWDFSHIAAVKHIYPPYSTRLLVRPDLVQWSRQMHLRPFNGHHAQIPATDGQGGATPEIMPYLEFVEALVACWLKGAKGGEVLYVCPEFGPVDSGYGLSSFADVWKDAIWLRARTEEIWARQLRKWGK